MKSYSYASQTRRLADILVFAEEAVRQLLPMFNDTKYTGGYLCAIDSEKGGLLMLARAGEVHEHDTPQRMKEIQGFAREKADRLLENMLRGGMDSSHHLTSWESRDPDNKRYGGAVRTLAPFILAFSGLTESADEAVVAYAAYREGSMSLEMALAISNITNNHYLRKLLGIGA